MEVAAVPAEMVTGPAAIREYPLSHSFSFFFYSKLFHNCVACLSSGTSSSFSEGGGNLLLMFRSMIQRGGGVDGCI